MVLCRATIIVLFCLRTSPLELTAQCEQVVALLIIITKTTQIWKGIRVTVFVFLSRLIEFCQDFQWYTVVSNSPLLNVDTTFDAAMHIRTWGLASVYAYRSYNDAVFFQIAHDVWNDAHVSEITTENVDYLQEKVSLRPTCSGCKYPALGKIRKSLIFYI